MTKSTAHVAHKMVPINRHQYLNDSYCRICHIGARFQTVINLKNYQLKAYQLGTFTTPCMLFTLTAHFQRYIHPVSLLIK